MFDSWHNANSHVGLLNFIVSKERVRKTQIPLVFCGDFITFAPMNEDFDIREQQLSTSEKEFENALRPLAFNDFSG